MDLTVIAPGFPADEGDLNCIPPLQEYLLALRHAQPQLRMAVIALHYPFTTRRYVWHGIEVHACGGRNRTMLAWRTWMRARSAFKRIERSGPVRAVHSLWLGEAAWLGMRAAARAGVPHVLTLMGQDARDGARWWRSIPRKPVTVCLTERHAATFRSMSGVRCDAIIPWGIARSGADADAVARDTDLLFVGSLLPVKRPLEFVDLVAELQGKDPGIKAAMIGDGPLRERIEHVLRSPNAPRITLTGTISRPEVLRWMRRSRVLVHTAAYESQGYVFDEALANGMSLVSFAVGSAQASERWVVVKENGHDLQGAVRAMLDRTVSTEPLIMHDIDATVNAYLRCYGLA